MFRNARRLLLGPLLAVCASGAVLTIDAGAAPAFDGGTGEITGIVKADGATRASATNAVGRVDTVRAETRVVIKCRVNGQYVKGTVGNSTQWDLLSTGKFLAHANVQTSATIPACPEPVTAPMAPAGPLATTSNAAFLAAAVAPARASQYEFKVPASVTLAQAILESGWGKSKLSVNDRNYFGMKCFGNPGTIAIGCHDYVTTECDQATQTCFTTTATFRVYHSPTDSFRDHGKQLATLTRYKAAFNYPNNPNQFAAEIHKAGYATDLTYTDKLVGIMVKYNLYQYDLP
ncbi:sporangiospore maturation cell wall hydrolase GsmA [Virgisporangium aurantiacum]|uniref:Mannosyl-glycoprotein endo-beta-N-acetylglucosamidase-like domain-containing protein n=1 Tax=Virgisporangium aurantiacum TaxID=175570 RepID=A0A8J4DXX4_9ACTN|nr:sporangiospore maturation cell wall hydrolase GsmA [Virgisporangium aurantiacum]GIJ52497.1 hypothetical protein Vau01_000130 [Virgisporangium aurantiacum]